MKFSKLTQRIQGEGADAWNIHYRALERQAHGDDVIVLSIGDPDFDTPEAITEAAVESLRGGATHYADVQGIQRLREVISEDHRKRTGQPTDASHVAVTVGAQCALYSVAQCILETGDEVIVPEPMYVAYEGALRASGATIVRAPLHSAHNFKLRAEDIERAITSETRALLVNTPHNPTGTVIDQQTMGDIARLCIQNDLWLISDEVYAGLTFEKDHVSFACLPEIHDRTVVIDSLSKSHAMTGWRLGWVIAPEPLVECLSYLSLCMLYGCPTFIQDAACKAFEASARESSNRMREIYRSRRDAVSSALASSPALKAVQPEAGMFVMVDVRDTGLSADEFSARLLNDHGVSVLAGEAFGQSASGFIRLSLTVDADRLAQACQRMSQCAEECIANTKRM